MNGAAVELAATQAIDRQIARTVEFKDLSNTRIARTVGLKSRILARCGLMIPRGVISFSPTVLDPFPLRKIPESETHPKTIVKTYRKRVVSDLFPNLSKGPFCKPSFSNAESSNSAA